MPSPYDAPGSDLWDLLGRLYVLSLLLSPLLARWRWGLRAALYWTGAEFLIVAAVSAFIYLVFFPDWQPLPRLGAGVHTQEEAMLLISGVAQLQSFATLTLVLPAIAIIGGAMLTLASSALLQGWRSLRGGRPAG